MMCLIKCLLAFLFFFGMGFVLNVELGREAQWRLSQEIAGSPNG